MSRYLDKIAASTRAFEKRLGMHGHRHRATSWTYGTIERPGEKVQIVSRTAHCNCGAFNHDKQGWR